MTAQEIKSLPKEFDFKSNINPIGIIYHAIEKEHCYVVTTDHCEWTYDKHEFRQSLFRDEFVVVGREPKLYLVTYKVWDIFGSTLYDSEMLSVGSNKAEALNRVKSVVDEDARGFYIKEITDVFGYTITVKKKEETQ